MSDLMVVAVILVSSLQVLVIGGAMFFGALEQGNDQSFPSSYQPMEILTKRAARTANPSEPAIERPEAA
jgi:hypothetical protein